MGSQLSWICTASACEHELERPVSGGKDRGFTAKTETRICTACRDVADYVIGAVSDPSHQTFSADELAARANPDPPCSQCGARTTAWNRRCPICGKPMKPSGMQIIMFD